MIESATQNRIDMMENETSIDNFVNKVILLIGNDAAVLNSLAIELAAKGSDIALASSQLSDRTAESIREKVEQAGGRFLLLDKNFFTNIHKGEGVIDTIKKELGKIDILIDLSAKRFKKSNNGTHSETPYPRWRLSTAILQEITS
jgi:enoyl-[acyl-carrier-protein] reductase (NADH)